jgi:hypothetical protein
MKTTMMAIILYDGNSAISSVDCMIWRDG